MIKLLLRWGLRLALVGMLLIASVLLGKDRFARSYAERQIRKSTGFEVKLGNVEVGLFEPRLRIENLVIYNPPEFGNSPFLAAPKIDIEYLPREMALGTVHFKILRLTISELNIVSAGGRTNAMEFLSKVIGPSSATNSARQAKSGEFSGIDLLDLSVGNVRFADLERPKRNQSIELNLENHLVRNVQSAEDFSTILLNLLFREGITIYVDENR